MDSVTLRPATLDDELPIMDAHYAMLREGFTFATGRHDGESWSDFLSRHNFYQYGREGQWVSSRFLVAEVNGTLVGRASIRFELDALLAHEGGHVGYGVVARHRRRGYATQILTQSLEILRLAGVTRVLLTCAVDNEASAKVIRRCGGVSDSKVVASDGGQVQRFWIEEPPLPATSPLIRIL